MTLKENMLHEVSEAFDDISVSITEIRDMCEDEENTLEDIRLALEQFLETIT